MRSIPMLAASLALIGSAAAQSPPLNEFALHPEAIDAVSRANLPITSAGDVLVAVTKDDFQYVGNGVSTTTAPGQVVTRLYGMSARLQDFDGSTQDPFTFTVIPEDPANPGQPDPTSGNELVRTPVVTPPAKSGVTVFDYTMTFATPLESTSLVDSTFFYGVGLVPNPISTDGLFVDMASYYGLGSMYPMTHDNPSMLAKDVTWSIDRSLGNTVSQASQPRTQWIRLLTDATVFRVGQDVVFGARTGPNPMFGAGGIWPDNKGSRNQPAYADRMGQGDGIVFRTRDASLPGGMVFTFVSTGFSPVRGFQLSPVQGGVPIDFTTTSFLQLPGANGMLQVSGMHTEAVVRPSYLAQGQLMFVPAISLYFMSIAADLSSGTLKFSNGQAVHFD